MSAGSGGSHLLQNQSGRVVVLPSRTMSVTVTNGWGVQCGFSYSVQQDTRLVTISCLEVDGGNGSSYKDPPITGPVIHNVRQPDRTMRGDTVKPPVAFATRGNVDYTTLSYTANVGGNWNADSSFLWNSSLTSYNIQGTFSLPADPVSDFSVDYPAEDFSYGNAASPGQDHIYIHLTDSRDSANGTANYRMHFHDQWEPASWPADGGTYKVMGPDPEVPSWPTYPWKTPSLATTISYPAGAGVNFSYQEAGFKDVDGGLDLGADPVVAHFGFTYQPGPEITQTAVLAPNPPLGYGQMTWAVYREDVSRTKGHLDEYGVNGYVGLGVWREDEMTGIDTNLYVPYASTGSTPTNPPAGWNPPGY